MNRINPSALFVVALGASAGALAGVPLLGLTVALAVVIFCEVVARVTA